MASSIGSRIIADRPGYGTIGAMSDYSIANLRDIEDLAVKGGFSDSQEARFAREQLGAQQVGISLQKVKPGKRHAFGHRHAEDEEIYVVLAGSGSVRLDDETVEVGPMDAIRVAPSVSRGFEAGPDGLELIAFGTHHEGDAEMAPGFWDD
jgi:mannose-6-phosphate isomerase-like protein (cupin superfamily)